MPGVRMRASGHGDPPVPNLEVLPSVSVMVTTSVYQVPRQAPDSETPVVRFGRAVPIAVRLPLGRLQVSSSTPIASAVYSTSRSTLRGNVITAERLPSTTVAFGVASQSICGSGCSSCSTVSFCSSPTCQSVRPLLAPSSQSTRTVAAPTAPRASAGSHGALVPLPHISTGVPSMLRGTENQAVGGVAQVPKQLRPESGSTNRELTVSSP